MVDFTKHYVIGDDTPSRVYDAMGMGKGLEERNYDEFPQGCYASAPAWDLASMPLVPWEEIPDRIAYMEEKKIRLVDMIKAESKFEALDQGSSNYCWYYSGTAAVIGLRIRNNQPYERLSGHSGAWVIKNGRNEGGWGAQGLDFLKDRGVMPTRIWTEKSTDGRRFNTPANWVIGAEYRATEGFVDLNPRQYDRELTVQQIITCYLNCIPVISDYMWWRHSVCGLWCYDAYPSKRKNDPSRYAANEILNSWKRTWGQNGYGILKDSKAFPDGATGPRATWGN